MVTIDFKLKTYEQLQFEITKLNTDIYLKDKEIERLNTEIDYLNKLRDEDAEELKKKDNIINELEKHLKNRDNFLENRLTMDKLKSLKERE